MAGTKIRDLSDEKLAELSSTLATERTRIRKQQVEVQAEIDLRAALATMPASARNLVNLRLEGGVAPTGDKEV